MSVQNVTNPSLQNLFKFLHMKMCKLKIAHNTNKYISTNTLEPFCCDYTVKPPIQ